jgi:hypothetical protein
VGSKSAREGTMESGTSDNQDSQAEINQAMRKWNQLMKHALLWDFLQFRQKTFQLGGGVVL